MRSKSRVGGRGQEGRVCGQLPPRAGGERRGAGKLGEVWPSSAAAGLGLETVTLGRQKSVIFDCFCPQDSQLGCRGEN